MSTTGEVVSVNVSVEKGTPKQPVERAVLDETGLVGDAHAGAWHRQVSLLSQESVDRFAAQIGRTFAPGEFAENLTVRGIDLLGVSLMDRLCVGPAELEVTQIGKECHGDDCAVFRAVGRCMMPQEGIFCRVLRGGPVQAGDEVRHVPHVLRIRVITLSDRASRGEYEDLSGPRGRALLEEFLAGTRWHAEVETAVLPDDADGLRTALIEARDAEVAAVFTTGGTGVGPRDIAPEVVGEVCDRTIPGIMDAVRIKCGARNPRALLSRSVAGVAGRTLVYSLPGSVRAVEEYMPELLATFEHLLLTVNGLDVHERDAAPAVWHAAASVEDVPATGAVREVVARQYARHAPGGAEQTCRLAAEDVLLLEIDGAGTHAFTCMPTDARDLAVGFVFTEGLIAGPADVAALSEAVSGVLRMQLTRPARLPIGGGNVNAFLNVPPHVGDTFRISAALLPRLIEQMQARQQVFRQTGGTHAAGIVDVDGNLIVVAEDVGRHNALDKAVGRCLLSGRTLAACGLLLSGRVSFEIVAKAARAGIELLAAVSAPSSLAVRAADVCGITLCAFVREGRATVYTHPHRIREGQMGEPAENGA